MNYPLYVHRHRSIYSAEDRRTLVGLSDGHETLLNLPSTYLITHIGYV